MMLGAPDDSRFVDNQDEHRYELWVGDERAGTIEYSTEPEAIVLIHTEVDPAFEGKGIGSRLVHDALADVRSRGLKVVPQCRFVRSYLGRHPQEAEILRRQMRVSLRDIPQVARTAWSRLRDELQAILGDDLVAMWAHGGTTFTDDPPGPGDLDTYVILNRPPDESTAQRIEDAHDAIAAELGIEWDAWYVLADDARQPEAPRHAYRPERRDTAWAINRAHWLAGRYAHLYGLEPSEIVPVPTADEINVDLSRELEHIERHIVEGDTDPYEATYALFNGSRILHALETGEVALSKRAAGQWALQHLPARWHPALHAATRAYKADATPEDAELLATEMAPFIAMVRERLPAPDETDSEPRPRWSGY